MIIKEMAENSKNDAVRDMLMYVLENIEGNDDNLDEILRSVFLCRDYRFTDIEINKPLPHMIQCRYGNQSFKETFFNVDDFVAYINVAVEDGIVKSMTFTSSNL